MQEALPKLILFVYIAIVGAQRCVQDSERTLQCDYFPADIPNGILEVEIADFMHFYKDLTLNSSTFRANNWSHVTHLKLRDNTSDTAQNLTFDSQCFSGLTGLQKLRLHIMKEFDIYNDTFLGLENTTTLDLSWCGRLSLGTFITSIEGQEILPKLEELDLSGLHYKVAAWAIEQPLLSALAHTNLQRLKVIKTGISMIRPMTLPRNLRKLKILDLSYSNIGDWDFNGHINLSNIELFDLAFVSLPKRTFDIPVGNLTISRTDLSNFVKTMFQNDPLRNILSTQRVNFSSLIRMTSLRLDRCTAIIDYDIQLNVKEIVVPQNNLKRLDVRLVFQNHTVDPPEIVDLSSNGLEFLHPSLLSVVPNIKRLNLSHNQLSIMAMENITLFETLLSSLTLLESIGLSSNGLKIIPKDMFKRSSEVLSIDLSNNRIDQVTFLLDNMKKLQLLDLRKNVITYLNGESMNNLNSLLSQSTSDETHTRPIVDLRNNPVSCSQCESESFLEWIMQSVLVNSTGLLCIDETGSAASVNYDSIKRVKQICERKVIIIATSVSVGFIVLAASITFVIFYRLRTRALRLKNQKRGRELLGKGQGQYEFAVFLSFSSTDEEFVLNFVDVQLSRVLKEMTGIDRELICTGDRNLRPGFFVLDETTKCLESSSLVIVVVSNAFCTSHYCHNELDQAYRLKKPIVLLLKENVNEELMMPMLRLLYKKNARILCTVENGQYVLKTSWENVGKSILDLIVDNV